MVSRREMQPTDLASVRCLLQDAAALSAPGFVWEVRRWDGLCYYGRTGPDESFYSCARIWTSESGAVLAALHPDGPTEVCMQVHPDWRALEPEMIAAIPKLWRSAGPPTDSEGPMKLSCEVMAYDVFRRSLLADAGFVEQGPAGVLRRMRVVLLHTGAVAPGDLAAGYRLTVVRRGSREDAERVAGLLNAAFSRNFHNADELLTFQLHAPCYREELDFAAETESGELACYVGFTLDDQNMTAICEPVCTHPAHRRKGLAASLIRAGIERLAHLGVQELVLGTGASADANVLYDRVGFTESHLSTSWTLQL